MLRALRRAPDDGGPRRLRRVVATALAVALVVALAYLALLRHPEIVFRHSVSVDNLTLWSDEPFDPAAGRRVLALARDLLRASPIDRPRDGARVFVCNRPWRELLFFLWQRGGGINRAPLTDAVFLRRADPSRDVVYGRSGLPATSGGRSMHYFVAHEVAHSLIHRALGYRRERALPAWVREGYADYVGRGAGLDFARALAAFRAGDETMSPRRSGLYLRYHLRVAYLLDRRGLTVAQLFATRLTGDDVDRALAALPVSSTP